MPRFLFDVRDDDGIHEDQAGLEFDNLEQARCEALRALGELFVETKPADRSDFIAIDIRCGKTGAFLTCMAISAAPVPEPAPVARPVKLRAHH